MLYCEKDFDVKTMELVGIFVKKYRCFENQFFSLHPLIKGYISKKKGGFVIHLYDNGEYDLFRAKKLNVITLCGKNGCGKSTLIELIPWGGNNPEDRTLFFVDKARRVAVSTGIPKDMSVTYKIKKEFNAEKEYSERECIFSQIERNFSVKENLDAGKPYDEREDGVNFWYNFIYRYIETPELFFFENDGSLFTHYEIHFKTDYVKDYIQPLFKEGETIFSYEDYVQSPLYLIIANKTLDVYSGEKLKKSNIKTFGDYIGFLEKKYPKLKKINQELKDFLYTKTDSSKILTALPYKSYRLQSKQDLANGEKIFHQLIRSAFEYIEISDDHTDLMFFCPLKIINGEKRYIGSLSDGERLSLMNRCKIYASLFQIDDYNGFLIHFDEPESFYHPEFARNFWKNIVDEIAYTKKYLYLQAKGNDERREILKKRYITIMVSTHSPFILSDLFNHNIIALEKIEGGKIEEKSLEKKTFAGNIAELLCDSMFMDGMIGSFAEKQIQSLFRKKIKDESDLNNRKWLVEQIGDPILKNLLMSELEK